MSTSIVGASSFNAGVVGAQPDGLLPLGRANLHEIPLDASACSHSFEDMVRTSGASPRGAAGAPSGGQWPHHVPWLLVHPHCSASGTTSLCRSNSISGPASRPTQQVLTFQKVEIFQTLQRYTHFGYKLVTFGPNCCSF
jgi:hypothetical protein